MQRTPGCRDINRHAELARIFRTHASRGGGSCVSISRQRLDSMIQQRAGYGMTERVWTPQRLDRLMADASAGRALSEKEFVTLLLAELANVSDKLFPRAMDDLLSACISGGRASSTVRGATAHRTVRASTVVTTESRTSSVGLPLGQMNDPRWNRCRELSRVFKLLDLEHRSYIGVKEIKFLGESLGDTQKHFSAWSAEKADKLLRTLDPSGERKIHQGTFVAHFERVMTKDGDHNFSVSLEQLRACATEYKAQRLGAALEVTEGIPDSTFADVEVSSDSSFSTSPSPTASIVHRSQELGKVFCLFDLDNSGAIDPEELMVLGILRKELGHKMRVWTEERNSKMIAEMDRNADGLIQQEEFVEFYLKGLSNQGDPAFMQTINEFHELVQCHYRVKREQQMASRTTAEGLDRERELRSIFRLFDLDKSGTVERSELMVLGKRRQELGQKARMWTEAKNQKMMNDMDTDADGLVSESEFVRYFMTILHGMADRLFMKTINEFKELVRCGKSQAAVVMDRSITTSTTFSSFVERPRELKKVFRAFDMDKSGKLESKQLLILGKRRQELGQKTEALRIWTEEKNLEMIRRMDKDNDGVVDTAEFVSYFLTGLADVTDRCFMKTMYEFMALITSYARKSKRTKAKTDVSGMANLGEILIDRGRELRKVFKAFDIDRSGQIEFQELLILGQRRQELGQQCTRLWTEEKIATLLNEMDLDSNGTISEQEFVKHFLRNLSGISDRSFMQTIYEFLDLVRGMKTRRSTPISEEHVTVAKSSIDRRAQLIKVFVALDMDGSGSIELDELLLLGKQRTVLEHTDRRTGALKSREWTRERNEEYANRMDKDGDRKVQQEEFVQHFLGALEPHNDNQFMQTIADFLALVKNQGVARKEKDATTTSHVSEDARVETTESTSRFTVIQRSLRLFAARGMGEVVPVWKTGGLNNPVAAHEGPATTQKNTTRAKTATMRRTRS